MEFTNDGASVYHRVLATYARDMNGNLIRSMGQHNQWFTIIWPSIQSEVIKNNSAVIRASNDLARSYLPIDDAELGVKNIEIYELPAVADDLMLGIVIKATSSSCTNTATTFERQFAKLVLRKMWIIPHQQITEVPDKEITIVREIVDLFDDHLRYSVANDKWESKGREYFTSKVQHFVHNNRKLELCLPAFPCKSSNPQKVGGFEPDKGEEMALRRLHDFVDKVDVIYQPGARIWIISDGHVFSDCIGVDDQTVDSYGDDLKELNQSISASAKNPDGVCFRSLVDLFDLSTRSSKPEAGNMVDIPHIDHHIATRMTGEAELSRKILMAGCQPGKAALRARIDSGDPSILALYRGFSRFMLEDLDLNPLTRHLSRSQRRKLSVKVSFEMILRNQAYSNLVEMIFPDHLRLSIHAHNNAGPKFGIRLFDKNFACSSTGFTSNAIQSSQDLLHIPTPWHNCVAQVEGDTMAYIIKSQAVKDAFAAKSHSGNWISGNLSSGQGGYYSLTKLPTQESDADAVPTLVDKAQASVAVEEGEVQKASTDFELVKAIHNVVGSYLKPGALAMIVWIRRFIRNGVYMMRAGL
ncbi:MAG: hypothetical protein Q9227_008816 [Pyrenula ochraceoflavens]